MENAFKFFSSLNATIQALYNHSIMKQSDPMPAFSLWGALDDDIIIAADS